MKAVGLIAGVATSVVVLGGAVPPAHGGAVAGGSDLSTGSASAERAPSCGSSLQKYRRDGRVVAEICSGNQGRTWTLQARGPYRGVEKFMKIRVCRESSTGQLSLCDNNQGQFEDYAGPVTSPRGPELFIVKMTDGRGRTLVNARKRNAN